MAKGLDLTTGTGYILVDTTLESGINNTYMMCAYVSAMHAHHNNPHVYVYTYVHINDAVEAHSCVDSTYHTVHICTFHHTVQHVPVHVAQSCTYTCTCDSPNCTRVAHRQGQIRMSLDQLQAHRYT